MLTGTNVADDPYMGNDPFHYVNAVDNDRLTWFVLPSQYHHINSDSKTIYRVNGAASVGITINKLQKLCGGGSSSSSPNCPTGFVAVGSYCIEPTMSQK